MILNGISILNFKNIEEAVLQFSPKVNCFIGNNGMGKTNILDAIYYLSFSKSYINQSDSMVVNHNADFLMLKGVYTRRDENLEVTLSLQRGKRKTLKRNGKEYRKLSEHIGLLPVVMVSPMDWELIRGAGDERRRLMDMIISQSNAEYLAALIKYSKAVENRNVLIKQGYRDPILFETVEEQLCSTAQYIHKCRKAWVNEFSPIFMEYYQAISGSAETVSLAYKSHLNDQSMTELLAANRERDIIIGYTTRGVHRDDIELLLGEHSMRKTGSQGQCKTYTIALRLAQYDFLKQVSGITPVLLLDDIFDKLDASRVENIISMVSNRDNFGQIFITDTNRSHLDEIVTHVGGDYRIFTVNKGVVKSLNTDTQGGLL
ncbi:MAG: DNA replication/repair protein RecF [Bacteroidales bacterium]|nr:DNA replication/repair protein RecF [Bacteroidales bacterium]